MWIYREWVFVRLARVKSALATGFRSQRSSAVAVNYHPQQVIIFQRPPGLDAIPFQLLLRRGKCLCVHNRQILAVQWLKPR